MQIRLDRKVLLKVIHPQWARDPELVERFDREGKAMARINHPNVVRVFDSGWEEGLPYLALEWVEGGSLGEKLKGGPLPQNEVKRLARELLDGLTAVHEAGLLHRDIKPDNIMMASDGGAKLTDFSLAGLAHQSTLTGHDAIVGSPAYIAPELIDGKPPDKRSDLYGVGVVLYEALTGSNPFDMGDPMATLDRVRKGGAQKLTGRGRIEASLARLIDSLLEPNPDDRPPDAAAGLLILKGAPPLESVHATPQVPQSRKRRWMYPVGAGALAVGLIGLVLFMRERSTTISASGSPELSIRPSTPSIVEPKVEAISKESPRAEPVQVAETPVDSPTVVLKKSGNVLSLSPSSPSALEAEGNLVLVVLPWGNVELDGVEKGLSPIGELQLKSGSHRLKVTHPSLLTSEREFIVSANRVDTIRIDLRAEAAAIWISASPWGYLWIDRDSLGLLPREGPIWLSPGKRVLKIENPELGWWTDSLEFKAGDRMDVKVNLQNGTMIATVKAEQ